MSAWISKSDVALLTDVYQITMLQSFFDEGMDDEAVCDLYVRTLPERRNYLVACGLDDALSALEALSFDGEALAWLRSLGQFTEPFLEHLGALRFTGSVHAVPEGTPVFAGEPILQIVAPLPQAQLVGTLLTNQIAFQTAVASKAARIVSAAAGKPVAELGLRRAPGLDAGLKMTRAAWVAGFSVTSNLLAARRYGIHAEGSMAHSYVQASVSELDAFRNFVRRYPETTLLPDNYDRCEGLRNIIRLARELGDDFRVRGIRLDSGDLVEGALEARRMLDEAGLHGIKIYASGGLDEYRIAALVASGAPIDAVGAGTLLGASSDSPVLDVVYKLVSYAGRGRMKLAPNKLHLPHRKQVFRSYVDGEAAGDVIGLHEEELSGTPLLVPVMRDGRRLPAGAADLDAARARCRQGVASLPARLRDLATADPPYSATPSERLLAEARSLQAMLGTGT